MAEELTTEMHYEFVDDSISKFDFTVLAMKGAINRGLSKKEALAKYQMTEREYDENIERCLGLDF